MRDSETVVHSPYSLDERDFYIRGVSDSKLGERVQVDSGAEGSEEAGANYRGAVVQEGARGPIMLHIAHERAMSRNPHNQSNLDSRSGHLGYKHIFCQNVVSTQKNCFPYIFAQT